MPRKTKKIFVLDTSVILHDNNAIFNFQEHDVAIPITVLEEIDQFKKGNDIINYHAREFIRGLDRMSDKNMMAQWIPLNGSTHGKFRVLIEQDDELNTHTTFGNQKNDHTILNTALTLAKKETGKKIILVTKDINLRVKARAMNLLAEDYETGKIKDVDHLPKGTSEIQVTDKIIDNLYKKFGIPASDIFETVPPCNQYVILKSSNKSGLAYFNPISGMVERVDKQTCYGITPKNAEQTFAMHAVLNPEVQLVSISGSAGTGKTLLALAAALEQRRHFKQIYLARPIVPLSNKDIGYLPGDANSKINPYMQPIWDNLSFIKNQYTERDKEYKKIEEMVQQEKLFITPLAYIRGRSLSNIIFIVDEAQNLTPHEIKTIITRAGENTKIIFTGDIHQIDTPYLDTQSNGLSYLMAKMENQPLYARINLEKGERSPLANLASKLL